MKEENQSYDPIKKWMDGDLEDHDQDATINELKRIDQELTSYKAGSFDKERAWQAIASEMEGGKVKTISLSPFDWAIRIAAAVTILLVAGYYTINSFGLFGGTEIRTIAAQKEQMYLPDSSRVYLNAQSSIAYENSFDEERVVEIDGEAFFEVTHGKSFKVNTTYGTVEVLGTRFNVLDRDDFFEVVCLQGKVLVTTERGDTATLTRGHRARLNGTQFMRGQDQYVEAIPSWISGRSEFTSMPLSLVIDEYERQFGITIQLEGIDESQLYTGSFSHKNQEEAIRTLAATLGVSHQMIDGKSVLLRGESM